MDQIAGLSPAKCILLASSLASSSNTRALRKLVFTHLDLFSLELTCRILLTFLPESTEPPLYTPFLEEVIARNANEQFDDIHINASAVLDISDVDAQKQLKKLRLLPLKHSSMPHDATDDTMTLFLINRAHRIDADTGLLPLVSQLVPPFLDRSEYLRDWYIGTTVPYLRFEYEYYPAEDSSPSLETFEELDGSIGVSTLLSKTENYAVQGDATADTVGRDFRGILAPWILAGGQSRGKKRKRGSVDGFVQSTDSAMAQDEQPSMVLSADTLQEWQAANEWILSTAVNNFGLAVKTIEGWNGPNDVDLGVPEEIYGDYQLSEQLAQDLQRNYCQAALASIYAVEQDAPEITAGAHNVLVRLANLLGFEPPPPLATSVQMLPRIERDKSNLADTLMSFLQRDSLLRSDNPLTTPNLETFSLLQMLVHSAYLLATLGHNLPVAKVAKLRFWSEDGEQLRFVQRILHTLVNGQRRDEDQWQYTRDTMLWLWDWAIGEIPNSTDEGYGVFGKVKRASLESELLKSLCRAGQYSLVTRTYLEVDPSQMPLSRDEVEKIIVAVALHFYDNASNGNKTRGGAKKASDIIAAFRAQFPDSAAFRRCDCLIAATHALSFYSLTLQRGVPFQPVSIRLSEDPVSLIGKVLEQNSNSYTKLDDLINIGRNLVKARFGMEPNGQLNRISSSEDDEASQLVTAERRVTSMAIDSALDSDDFETSYSYVVNRLSPPPSHPGSTTESTFATDDISWRAALRAGRHRSNNSPQTKSNSSTTSPQVRRLEQRMELLSHSLQLAPSQNLPEVLAAWRRVEEELLALLAQESEAEEEFDDNADRGDVRRIIPGSFGQQSDLGDTGFVVQPRRKELGRGAAEEAPMGLFQVARGAAAAFSRSTSGSLGPGKAAGRTVSGESTGDEVDSRQRKRDMVASAVTGGLASGLGWVLGAKPVYQDQDH